METNAAEANRKAWDRETERGNHWTIPASPEAVAKAREGLVETTLTPNRIVPGKWISRIGREVLALAAGGGQQGPLLAASGRKVTVLDISPEQLRRDRETAEREGLELRTVEGSMDDLSAFAPASFDSVVNPVSINFTPDAGKVFAEVARVLRPGGTFLMGAANPVMYIFDVDALAKGKMKIRYTLPYDAFRTLSGKQRRKLLEKGGTFEFSHSLDSLLGGLCRAGFRIEDFYGDTSDFEPVDSFVRDCYFAVLAVRT